jgi:hypothetical protein
VLDTIPEQRPVCEAGERIVEQGIGRRVGHRTGVHLVAQDDRNATNRRFVEQARGRGHEGLPATIGPAHAPLW